jgi:hypothetical protein
MKDTQVTSLEGSGPPQASLEQSVVDSTVSGDDDRRERPRAFQLLYDGAITLQ